MRFHKQEHLYNPEERKRGSCYPTVIACLMDLDLHDVPYFHLLYWDEEDTTNFNKNMLNHYCNGNYDTAEKHEQENFDREKSICMNLWWTVLRHWLASKGHAVRLIPKENYENWLKENVDVPYMVSGKSKRGVGHVVIYKNGVLFHDPHPSNDGIVELFDEPYEQLIKL